VKREQIKIGMKVVASSQPESRIYIVAGITGYLADLVYPGSQPGLECHTWCDFSILMKPNKEQLANYLRSRSERIAKVCHNVNRAYCISQGDTSQLPWEEAPAWQKESALKGVELHLSGEHGPEASHKSWLKEKIQAGWVWGLVKDAEKKTHPCMVPFKDLPLDQQAKDFIFQTIVKELERF
jgi:hypothetical protein